jgi:ABC-2 type transport system ATP-binding protein
LATPADADAAKSALSSVGPVDLAPDGRTIEVKVTDSGRALLDAVRRLDAASVEPLSLSVREPSLDDVFLTLTGHHVEPEKVLSEGDAA